MATLLAAVVTCAAGCDALSGKSNLDKAISDRDSALKAKAELVKANADLQTQHADDQQRMQTLMGLGDKRLEKLYTVQSIDLGRYTGGIDTDKTPGHDAIKVFLRPIDRDACSIKAAGKVTIQLYDLAEPAEKNLIGTYEWDVDALSKQWSGDFMTYHYSFVCPWRNGRPMHDEITVRVAFVDYLTGRTFTAQQLVKVQLPAAAKSTTQP